MPRPKRTPQILNPPFKPEISPMRKPSFIICFFVLSLAFGSVNTTAQTHPDVSGVPPQARGDYYFSQGKFKQALENYKQIMEGGADSSTIFRNMIKAWNATGALDEAEIYLKAYLQSHENSSAVWYALGYLYYLRDDNAKAEESFKRATELDPANGLAWNNWGAVLAQGKHFSEAVEKVHTAIGTHPRELMFFFNLQKIYTAMGEGQRFEAEYNDLVAKEGSAWGYGKTLARSIRQQAFSEYGEGNKAIAGFEKILSIYRQIDDVMGQVPTLFALGLLYEESGDTLKSQDFFKQVLAINPDHIQAREKIKAID